AFNENENRTLESAATNRNLENIVLCWDYSESGESDSFLDAISPSSSRKDTLVDQSELELFAQNLDADEEQEEETNKQKLLPHSRHTIKPSLMSAIYNVVKSSKDALAEGKSFDFVLACSLRIPDFSSRTSDHMVGFKDKVVAARYSGESDDEECLLLSLSNGRHWVYLPSSNTFAACILPALTEKLERLQRATASSSTTLARSSRDRQRKNAATGTPSNGLRMQSSPVTALTVEEQAQLVQEYLRTGEDALSNCCLFLPRGSFHCKDKLLAGSFRNHIYIWRVTEPSADQMLFMNMDEECLKPGTLLKNSTLFAKLQLSTISNTHVKCMDACIVQEVGLLAGGTKCGHVIIWELCEGNQLVKIAAHSACITALRIVPPTALESGNEALLEDADSDFDEAYDDFPPSPTLSQVSREDLPIGLLIGSQDGIVKRWEVGAPLLPVATAKSTLKQVTIEKKLINCRYSCYFNHRMFDLIYS
ncbi:wD repeat domain, partial [Cichlidogyrus casuarinus]